MAVKIPIELQEFIQGKLGWVATAAADGTPNVSIKGSLRVMDDEHLMFADLFSLKTRKNLEENPKIAVMVYDLEARKGYTFKGTAEQIVQGPVFDQVSEMIKKMLPQAPAPKSVVRITIESIFDQSMGPNSGKQIA